MRTTRLGRTELETSVIGLGTWAFGGPKIVGGKSVGWYGTNDRLAKTALVRAHDQGISHWDTADVYGDGHAERLIGQVWNSVPRDDVLLASKVGWDAGPYGHYYHPEQIRRQLERSLRYMRTECIDVYYLHHCDFGADDEYLDTALELLQRFRDEGKLRFIGMSDWSSDRLLRASRYAKPDVIQGYRNVVDDQYASSGLKEWAEDNDIGVVFFSPVKHGLLLGHFEGPVTFGAGDHRNDIDDFRDYGLLSRLRVCRQKVKERFPNVEEPLLHALLGALLHGTDSACALLGQHRPSQVAAAAKSGGTLSPEDARWVCRLYQENGRPTRASWKMHANGL